MRLIVEWANRNPVLLQVLVWPTLTALLTWVFTPRTATQWQALEKKIGPRATGALKLVAALGIDVPNLTKALQAIITGRPYQPASEYISARTIPPPSVPTPSDIPVTYEDDDTGSKGDTQ